jgi:hypothetical protein
MALNCNRYFTIQLSTIQTSIKKLKIVNILNQIDKFTMIINKQDSKVNIKHNNKIIKSIITKLK